MTISETAAAARENLPSWIDEHRGNVDSVIEVTGAPFGAADRDPMVIIPYLQRYIDELPLTEFEDSDWFTLLNDIVSFLARLMAVTRNATWQVFDAPSAACGYRYLLVAADHSGVLHFADPYQVVAIEFQQTEIDVVRMIASTEATLAASNTVI